MSTGNQIRPAVAGCRPVQWSWYCHDRRAGFSLIEAMIVLALLGSLSALGIPAYMDQRENSRVATAVTDIVAMSLDLQAFKELNGRFPDDLNAAGLGGATDPWGQSYQYLKIEGLGNNGPVKKDKFLVPLNTDYDLYSVGYDGSTHTRLSNASSADDVVRATNGTYVGLGADY